MRSANAKPCDGSIRPNPNGAPYTGFPEKELLEHSQKIANVGSYSLQIKTGKVNWSHQTYAIFGYEPGEIQPDFELVLKHVHKDDREH